MCSCKFRGNFSPVKKKLRWWSEWVNCFYLICIYFYFQLFSCTQEKRERSIFTPCGVFVSRSKSCCLALCFKVSWILFHLLVIYLKSKFLMIFFFFFLILRLSTCVYIIYTYSCACIFILDISENRMLANDVLANLFSRLEELFKNPSLVEHPLEVVSCFILFYFFLVFRLGSCLFLNHTHKKSNHNNGNK